MARRIGLHLLLLAGCLTAGAARADDQSQLVADTGIHGPWLTFDWPAVQIGVGSYEAGPTGVTVFRFPQRVSAAVDVRGGAPGTVNTDVLRLGYATRFVDAVVFAGGAVYGEETIAGVMTGLKDDGVRSGAWGDMAVAVGAVIYDFRGHRLNEIYPDKRLAQAALRNLRPGVFPLGAQGAGRMAMQGSFFGCGAHSGQGGAFRQSGEVKVAAFVVVNATGAVTDRDGRIVSCHRSPVFGDAVKTADLLARAEGFAGPPPAGPSNNTTISLVVTNRRMSPAELQRLAVQVHTSMARAIQPFSTADDGDTLFAVSTQEVGDPAMRPNAASIDFIAAETMWDAILASVPTDAVAVPGPDVAVPADKLAGLVGQYRMGPHETLRVALADGALSVQLDGARFFDLGPSPAVLHPSSETEFHIQARYGTRLRFEVGPDGTARAAIVDPGRWAQQGERVGR